MRIAICIGVIVASLSTISSVHADIAPGADNAKCGAAGPMRVVPVPGTHKIPPYPPIAVRTGEQGVSVLRVVISAAGNVAEDAIIQSSGSERLDSAALDYVKENWRWQPIPDCKAPVSTTISIGWHLNDPVSAIDPAVAVKWLHFISASANDYPLDAAKRAGIVLMMGAVDDKGSWGKVQTLFGDPALQAKSEELIKTHHWSPLKLDGKFVSAVTVVGVIWTPSGEKPIDPEQLTNILQMFSSMQKK